MNPRGYTLGKAKTKGPFLSAIVLTLGLILSTPHQAQAVISLVQTANDVTNGGTSVSATFSSTPTQDNLLVAIVGVRDSVTINTPSGWSTAISEAGSPGQAIFYKIAGASEPTEVNFTDIVSSSTRLGLHIYEYSGVNALDQASSDTGTGTAVSSGSVTTTSANEAIIAGFVINAGTSFDDASWTNSFTEQNDFANSGDSKLRSTYAGADRILSTVGTYSTAATAGASGAWRGQIASFKPELSVGVSNPTFSFGAQTLDTWLTPQSTSIINHSPMAENFVGSISQFTDGANTWGISSSANGADTVRAQWSTNSETGPWTDILAYDADFTIATNVAAHDSLTFWLRIQTPTSTTSYDEYSSTLTVTAQEY